MRFWPVPESYQKSVPKNGQPGSFWENRGDRRHAGVDIFAPEESPVLAIEDGLVQIIRPFTSKETQSYWNSTLEILVLTDEGIYHRYAELKKVLVARGDRIKAGTQIGLVGSVLNPRGVSEKSPEYIKNLLRANKISMLHLEMYNSIESIDQSYSGGNYYLSTVPAGLLDPSQVLESLLFVDSH